MQINRSGNEPNWSVIPFEILLHIISMVNDLDRITNVAEVCRSWRAAASDKMFFKTLDISECRQHVKPPRGNRAQEILQLAFVRGIKFGGLNLTKLVFDHRFLVTNGHLRYAYQSCPNLKELVVSFPNSTTKAGLKKACRFWPKLESLFIAFSSFFFPPGNILDIVGAHCLNLSVLKLCCCYFNTQTLEAIKELMPRLKVLSVRCGLVLVDLDLVVEAFSSMLNLEEVYVSIHKVEPTPSLPDFNHLPTLIDNARNLRRFPRLRVYHVCYWEECNSCLAATMGDPPLNISNPFRL